jgi:hypothetical protein
VPKNDDSGYSSQVGIVLSLDLNAFGPSSHALPIVCASCNVYAFSFPLSNSGFLGMSANMTVPFEDSKFLELVFLNRVWGFDLRIR